MKQHNPFVITGYAGPEYFCDRVRETMDLIEALENDRNVTVMAPRRTGKTGLIEHAFRQLREERGYKTVVLDLFPTQNLADFTKLFASAVFRSLETNWEKALSAAERFVRSCRPSVTVNPADLSHKFSFDVTPAAAETTLGEIFSYLASRKERVAIAFDEFQQIAEYPEKGVEALLRSHIQNVPFVGFVFAGSRQHLMREMFTSVKRPFFQSTQKLHLEAIDREAYYDFADRHFRSVGRTLPQEVFDCLYARFDGITWYLQSVMNRLYGRGIESIGQGDVDAVVTSLVAEEADDYKRWCELLPEGSIRLLRAVAEDGVANDLTSAGFIARHGLTAPSSVALALDRLLDKELLYKRDDGYVVYDRLFSLWLASV